MVKKTDVLCVFLFGLILGAALSTSIYSARVIRALDVAEDWRKASIQWEQTSASWRNTAHRATAGWEKCVQKLDSY